MGTRKAEPDKALGHTNLLIAELCRQSKGILPFRALRSKAKWLLQITPRADHRFWSKQTDTDREFPLLDRPPFTINIYNEAVDNTLKK
jgi:hypothetical protein